jgi:hypothetical protein
VLARGLTHAHAHARTAITFEAVDVTALWSGGRHTPVDDHSVLLRNEVPSLLALQQTQENRHCVPSTTPTTCWDNGASETKVWVGTVLVDEAEEGVVSQQRVLHVIWTLTDALISERLNTHAHQTEEERRAVLRPSALRLRAFSRRAWETMSALLPPASVATEAVAASSVSPKGSCSNSSTAFTTWQRGQREWGQLSDRSGSRYVLRACVRT